MLDDSIIYLQDSSVEIEGLKFTARRGNRDFLIGLLI